MPVLKDKAVPEKNCQKSRLNDTRDIKLTSFLQYNFGYTVGRLLNIPLKCHFGDD